MRWLLLVLTVVVGCTTHDSPSVVQANAAILSADGTHIGTLPDGRKVVRYQIDMGTSIPYDHWLYVVGDCNCTTVNHQERVGKQHTNEVNAILHP